MCNPPLFVPERYIASQFEAAVRAIQLPEEVLEWTKQALLQSHADENATRDAEVTSLLARERNLHNRIKKSYEDKLDGVLQQEVWSNLNISWQEELASVTQQIAALKANDAAYVHKGEKILELANSAYNQYVTQSDAEKRDFLKIILLNSTLTNATIEFQYKKPFDLMVEGSSFEGWLGGKGSNLHQGLQRPRSCR